ncbi:hypothetical protein GN244_ATG19463 [Phytophthora infestans]|uniref:Transmembrane protein n=1 Tax=Phytophthora infestans TaxID=4787 RepID=A0A833S4I9_PHYIN|nr:hypothetical protein GN244_ATG19463 [Phytophthora infestans]
MTSQGQEPLKRPRIAAWKVVAVFAALVLLTPVWIAYGCLGALLTLPSSTITKLGLQMLALLGSCLFLQIVFSSRRGVHDIWMNLELVGWILALLMSQWKLNQLLVFRINQKNEKRRMDVAGSVTLAILAAVSVVLWTRNREVLEQQQILSSYWMCVLAYPV